MRSLPFVRTDRPAIWGHRGASADAPENTLAAFGLALRQGADGVELDVQRCASGEVVVLHDDSLVRTTGLDADVARTPWSVLRTLDAGGWKGASFRGERIPLLADVLDAIPALLNIELKCDRADDGGLTRAVAGLVRDAGASGRVLLSSFNPLCLLRARALAPAVPRALLFEREQAWPLRRALAAPLVGAVALHPDRALATPARLARWRARGYAVGCWTVDEPGEARRLAASGATALITNRPGVLRALF